jgi:Effector Associated Constant Component 1
VVGVELRLVVDPAFAGDGEEAGEAIGSLYSWLAQDRELRLDHNALSAVNAAGRGEMGAVADIINVVISDTAAIGGLILSFCAWRDSRVKPPPMRLEIDRVELNLNGAPPEILAKLAAVLAELPETGSAPVRSSADPDS